MILNETSYFGAGCRETIAVEAARRGFKKAFFVTDRDLIRFKVADKVIEVFEKNSILYELFSDVKANPTITNVQNGVAAFKASGADFIVALGGGSSIDTAKGIGIVVNNPDFADVKSLEGVADTRQKAVPTFALPTTAGTAAEVTINYVIIDEEAKKKMVCVDPNDIPAVAIDDYVLKNMNFVFNEGNLDFFKKQYEQAMKNGGWYGVRKLSWHMIFRGKRLDDNGPMGASLIDLQMKHPNNSFLNYINETAEHLNYGEPRLADGTIARIWPHENTIWADDAFMAISFLARMAKMTGDMSYINDAANQVIKYHKYLWCPEKRILYHCYHTDTDEHGVAHWSRANGWVFMATADLLAVMPQNHPMRPEVLECFRRQCSGVVRYQGKNGLWHQLLDKEDSYEEITGTAMFVFGIARGVKHGWLHPDFIYAAEQGLKGMMTLMSDKGDVTKICVGTGIMPSPAYYYNRPTQENDPMGEGPVLRALIEMMDAPKYTEIKAEQQYDKIVVKK